ncbi:MAG TPA: S41 family peptidase, partial [Chloroflexota bacterium]|nr:S41 family peptidase [Chloroflexota bacterium]
MIHASEAVVRYGAALLFAFAPVSTGASTAASTAAAPLPVPSFQHLSSGRTNAPGLRTVEVGLNFLLDQYAEPLQPASLLQAAWVGALDAARDTYKAEPPKDAFPQDRAAAWAEFERRFALLTSAGADPEKLAQEATRAMARSLDDCHTRFAQDYEKEISAILGGERYGGIGATAIDAPRIDPSAPGPVIVDLFDGGPASSAGVRVGDAVIGVDGVDTKGLTSKQVVDLIRGASGTSVRLHLDRPGVAQPLEVTAVRGEIEVPLVKSHIIQPRDEALPPIGYVQFRSFSQAVESALPALLEDLYAQGARAWVLDLRQNGGGSLPTFTEIASLFVPEGTLGVTVDRSGVESRIVATGGVFKPFATPLAVLVGGNSASASELLTADLQEYGAARVFGETTAGCFGTSQLFRLPDGSGMWVTTRAL